MSFLQTCSTEVEDMSNSPKMMISCNAGACQPLCIVSRLWTGFCVCFGMPFSNAVAMKEESSVMMK